MRLLLSTTLVSLVFASCKTTPTASTQESSLTETQNSELICRAATDDHRIVLVRASVTEALKTEAPTEVYFQWKLMNPKGAIYKSGDGHFSSQDLSSGRAKIINEAFAADLELNKTPSLTVNRHSSSCTTLWSHIQTKNGTKVAAACNAIGTPAQGWYVNGKLLKHSKSCNQEVLACGTTPDQEGWFVQKKTEHVLISEERCAWRKDTPLCKAIDGVSAWYLGDRLVARDDECQQKQIECQSTPKQEGWFTFKRSEPHMLMAGSCNTSNSGQKTARLNLNQKNADQ